MFSVRGCFAGCVLVNGAQLALFLWLASESGGAWRDLFLFLAAPPLGFLVLGCIGLALKMPRLLLASLASGLAWFTLWAFLFGYIL